MRVHYIDQQYTGSVPQTHLNALYKETVAAQVLGMNGRILRYSASDRHHFS